MSISARLEDAYLLMTNGRTEGALLSVLVAIAGTSKQRFPKGTKSRLDITKVMGDGEAFEALITDETLRMVRTHFQVKTLVNGKEELWPLGKVLYKLFRCTLAHEAELPPQATFCADPQSGAVLFRLDGLNPLAFTISHGSVLFLADLVATAAENVANTKEVYAKFVALKGSSAPPSIDAAGSCAQQPPRAP